MSNFSSLDQVNAGLPGTAPSIFVGATPDSYAQITAAGYLNDINKKIKANDKFLINYADASVFPLNTGEASVFTELKVQYDPFVGNWSLIPISNVNSSNALANYGFHSATASYAGGAAAFTITDSRVSAGSVLILRIQSSANAVIVRKVLASNGSFLVTLSADPGASVMEYFSITPSLLLQNSGVHAAKYSNAGGSATITITDPLITASSVVNANFASSANAANVQKVTASAGTLTVLCSADPGVSVLSYVAVTPSASLATLGCYSAQYTNAGGSATTTITDANITATSIVTADWSSSANAVNINKVTPTASTLTILSSGDPGASVLSYNATPSAG
jgi:hypothetical protein